MSFTLPDLVIEGAIRKGFNFLRTNAGSSPSPRVEADNVVDIPLTNIENNPNFITNVTSIDSGTGDFTLVATFRLEGFEVEETLSDGTLVLNELNTTREIAFVEGNGIFTIGGITENSTSNSSIIDGTIRSIDSVVDNGDSVDVRINIRVPRDLGLGTNRIRSWIRFAELDPGFTGYFILLQIDGQAGDREIEGPGGEVLNMLFDFNTGSSTTDGGLDSSVSRKYSQEAFRLREVFRNTEIAIVSSFSDVQAHLPCISIQLSADGEDQGLALADDFGGTAGVFGENDRAGFRNEPDLNIIHANTTINVGVHSKEQLLTKYLYHIAKYFVLSSKLDLIRQNFIIATFRGSDFARDAAWQGDHVYTRFLNISGKTEDSWINLDEIVAQIDQINVQAFIDSAGMAFNNPASEVNSTILTDETAIETLIQVANSFYLGTGIATLVTRDSSASIISTEVIDITENNTTTNILTIIPPITMDHIVDSSNNITTFVIKGDVSEEIAQSQTVQTSPTNITFGSSKDTNNDADGVIHRTTNRT